MSDMFKSASRHTRLIRSEKVEKFCYLADTTGIRRGAVESVIRRIRSGSSNFKALILLLTNRGLLF